MSIFGTFFRVSTFGESHGVGVGCVVDGVPPNIQLCEEDIQRQLTRRRPGQSSLTTQRKEFDLVQILSGVEQGKTLGTPIGMLVKNEDQRKFDYAETSIVPRPGHADYTYNIKYGTSASSGGGRASARETIGRVAAGSIAEKWLLETYGTRICAWVTRVGDIEVPKEHQCDLEINPPTQEELDNLSSFKHYSEVCIIEASDGRLFSVNDGTELDQQSRERTRLQDEDPEAISVICTRCPHISTGARIIAKIHEMRSLGDTIGGIMTCVVINPPVGIGEPVFEKTEALLACAIMSLPATKGFEIGSGFEGTRIPGSIQNDPFKKLEEGDGKLNVCGASKQLLDLRSNNAGGTLGGITSGKNIVFRVAIKSVSSIGQEQSTCTYTGEETKLAVKGRHDPCVLPRASPLIEGMTALVIADLTMRQRVRTCPMDVGTLHPAS